MPLGTNGPYKSDTITALRGFDGTETKDVVEWCRRIGSQFATRVVFAINTWYPEFPSGYYFNKALVALLQEALSASGLSVVVEDNYQREGIVPVEPPGSLQDGDDYLLVDGGPENRGRLRIWESQGGRSAFYHDNMIIELMMDSDAGAALLQAVRERCRSKGVQFAEVPGNAEPPGHGTARLLKRIARVLGGRS